MQILGNMTTPIKQYQNVSFKELIAYSENNPNRDRALDSIEIIPVKPAQETSLDKLGLKGYKAFTLNPTGILSLVACINDPNNYAFSPKNVRTQLIIELATKLQEKTDELKNTALSRKRKKIHDLIGATYNGTVLEDKDYMDLYSGISFLTNTNFVLMKSAAQETVEEGEKQYDSSLKGEVVFSSDPTNWKSDQPVWIADYRARWVAVPTENNAPNIHKILAVWLATVEQTGWIVQWPEVNATKAELVEQLSVLPTWQITDKKLTKDVLAVRLGRANCIKVFTKWIMNTDDE
jgi:hypothetical protein